MKIITFKIVIGIIFGCFGVYAQDMDDVRKNISMLTSAKFAGRGYTDSGDKTTELFIIKKLKKLHLQSPIQGFSQSFNLSVNTFPSEPQLYINGKKLQCALDYLPAPYTSKIKGRFDIIHLDRIIILDSLKLKNFFTNDYSNKFVYIDTTGVSNNTLSESLMKSCLQGNFLRASGYLEPAKTLMHGVSNERVDWTHIYLRQDIQLEQNSKIEIDVQPVFEANYISQNILGIIPGKVDSFLVFTAHYDHLGKIGKDIIFPGANDNASGVSMLLELAKNFSLQKSKPKYSIAFIFFGAEELGLVGSTYFVNNPMLELQKIKVLINLDVIGSGDEGIRVVNGIECKKVFHQLDSLNKTKNLLPVVAAKKNRPNSDHFPFSQKKIPAIFIYTQGAYKFYHVPQDKADVLPLNKFPELFQLLLMFVEVQ